MKTTEWMQKVVDELSDELEAMEKEQEALEEAGGSSGTGKKKGGASAERSPEEQLAKKVRSHSFHKEKLEELIAAVEEGLADCDEVDGIKGWYHPPPFLLRTRARNTTPRRGSVRNSPLPLPILPPSMPASRRLGLLPGGVQGKSGL